MVTGSYLILEGYHLPAELRHCRGMLWDSIIVCVDVEILTGSYLILTGYRLPAELRHFRGMLWDSIIAMAMNYH